MKPSLTIRRLLLASSMLAATHTVQADFYWDTNGTDPGFGTAEGTWGIDAFWNSDPAGGDAGIFDVETFSDDQLNFGTAEDGLDEGTVTVSGMVDSGNMTFGSASGFITLTGGTINFASDAIIDFANESNAINSDITGSGDLEFRSSRSSTGEPHVNTLGTISNSGNVTFNAFGVLGNANTIFRLNGASDYTGNTSLEVDGRVNSNVSVILDTPNALPAGTVVNLANTNGTGTGRLINLDLNANSQTLAGLSAPGTPDLRIRRVHNSSEDPATLTIDGDTDETFIGILGSDGRGGGFDLDEGNNFSVVKEGSGTWRLGMMAASAVTDGVIPRNSYTGGTTVNGGGISFLTPDAIPETGNHTFAAGTTLGLGVSGGSSFSDEDVINAFNGDMTGALEGIVIDATTRIGLDTTLGNANFSGDITGSPARDLVKLGGNRLILSGTNTHTGATYVNSGTLRIDSPGALDGTSQINLAGDATLKFRQNDVTITAPINLPDAGQAATLRGHVNDSAIAINLGRITGSGDVLFTSEGGAPGNRFQNFNLTESGDYTGNTSIASHFGQNTTVVLGTDNGLSTTTVLSFGNNPGAGSGRQMNLNLNGFDQELGGLAAVGSANLRVFRIHNTSENAATLTINDDEDRTFRGILGSTSMGDGEDNPFNLNEGNNFGVVKEGTGTWTLDAHNVSRATGNEAAPNSYTGGTVLNQGGISLEDGAALGTGPLRINNTNTSDPGTDVLLTLAEGNNLTVGSLGGTIDTPASGENSATIVTRSGRALIVNQTADDTFEGGISGDGGLTLGSESTHTLVLAGMNSYSGDTTVSAGTLSLANPNPENESSTVTIADEATLNLDFIGTDTVDALFIGGTQMSAGVYGPSATELTQITGTGTLTVTSGPEGGYADWAATNAPITGGDPAADEDGDGVPNAIEYVLGGTIDTNDLDKLPAVSTSEGDLVFTFERDQASIADTTVMIEVGTDLVDWPDTYTVGADTGGSSAGVEVTKDSPRAGFDTVTLTLEQAADPKKFARLRVEID